MKIRKFEAGKIAITEQEALFISQRCKKAIQCLPEEDNSRITDIIYDVTETTLQELLRGSTLEGSDTQ